MWVEKITLNLKTDNKSILKLKTKVELGVQKVPKSDQK